MADYLCISATFLDRRYHGRGDGGEPEWPPSPLRLMQALVAANADEIGAAGELDAALSWLERRPAPMIVAPAHREGASYCLSVPNNALDLVAKAWERGNYFGTGDASPATHRTMKTVRPIHMINGDQVHYLWRIEGHASTPIDPLARASGRIVALGWGIDLVVAEAKCMSSDDLQALPGERWQPAATTGPVFVRVPMEGTLDALRDRHHAFIHRMSDDGFVPVPPLTRFMMTGYRRHTDPAHRPHMIFELRHHDGSFCAYPHRKLIHIAGMLRHLAIEAMRKDPPRGVEAQWVETYVAGHAPDGSRDHRQLSYLPLPSVGAPHTDPGVRRVMIAAPIGDDAWLDHIARRIAGRQLRPAPNLPDPFPGREPPLLVPLPRHTRDGVVRCYTELASTWHSFTPVILPGHDDHKPEKTRALIERALLQSGIDQPCAFEWSAFSRFPKSYSAHKYNKNKRPQGYFRPTYLNSQTAVHLSLRFHDGSPECKSVPMPGPLAIGAGRHCGLGIMARENTRDGG